MGYYVGDNHLTTHTMPATAAPFFIALNAGSGHAETAERQSIIESVLRGAGRQFQHTFSFKQIQVKVRTLSRRRHIKVATDGEVTLMSNPLEFRVMEEQLLLLKPAPG